MLNALNNYRRWFVVFLILSLVLLAGEYGKAIFDPSKSMHEQGSWHFPRNDCGDNYFLFTRLPNDLCLERGDSAERVEKAMEQVDPNIWNKSFDEANASWDHVLYRALRDILKWALP